jgi:hypothetical protein
MRGQRVAISASESPDLTRVGLLEGHLRLALGELARSVLLLGGKLLYAGHLDHGGYTALLVDELRRYGHKNRPLAITLPWSEHRRAPLSQLEESKRDLGLHGTVEFLDPAGATCNPSEGRGEAPVPETDPAIVQRALSAARRHVCSMAFTHVLIGGKREGFKGAMPGVLEEASLAVEAGKPLLLAGGFGGVVLDIVREVRPEDAAWLPPSANPSTDSRLADGLARLRELIEQHGVVDNGLDEEENRRLAATHRPSEIASLVSIAVGRLAGRAANV